MDVKNFADNIYLNDGIWFSNSKRGVSYPEEGNQTCFQIENGSFWFKHRNNCIVQAIKKFSKNEVFFDVGGGNGFVAKNLEDENIPCVLIEPGLQGALNAKTRGLKNIICSTFEDAGFKKNSAKAVGLFDVVEHIEDDTVFLKSIHSILADKGLVYITVPAYASLWSKEDEDAGHYRRYTTNSLSSVLKQSGFEIVYSSYIFSILPVPVLFFRTIPSLFGFNKKSNDLNKHKKEHSEKKGLASNLLNYIWNKEVEFIKNSKRIPFGGSCFIVARKK